MKGYKTIVLNLVMLIVTVLVALNPELVLDKVAIADSIETVFVEIATLWSVGAIIIRSFTDGPVGGGK